METEKPTDQPIPAIAQRLSGVVLDASDLGRTQAFYQEIFQHAGGAWESSKTEITYRAGAQTVGFVRRGRPRTYEDDAGYHTAYRVPRAQLGVIAEGLTAMGSTVQWWNEDSTPDGDHCLEPFHHPA
ncbi:MAG: hypothetical protein IH804_10720 [Planctomycetes bacterium]|nr:hypothetical protein [Planctomycetota bacterium]